MLIDWFTVVAQIVNFLILVALLKHFLYGPIVKAMEQREQRIAQRLSEGAAMREEAQQEAERYRHQQQDLEAHREEWFARTQQQVEQEKQRLLRQAQAEVEALRTQWIEALQREQQAFLEEFRQRASQQITITVRRALGDLASVSLEEQIVTTFIERLQHLNDEQLQLIRSSREPHEVVICSTFPISSEKRDQLIKTVQGQIAGTEIRFETGAEPLCGIELRDRGYKIAWNLEQYLNQLEAETERALKNSIDRKALVSR
ncbi:MAG: ATP F0F1 synthase subunit beta [Cyanophyceae cyanobacterium]